MSKIFAFLGNFKIDLISLGLDLQLFNHMSKLRLISYLAMLPFFILVNLTISDFSVPKLKIALDLAFSLLSNYMKHVKAWREEKSFGCFKFNKSLLSISDI